MADEGVIVEQDAAVGLGQYLAEIGRLHSKDLTEIGAAIQSGVNAAWGTAKVPQFRDEKGIGWVVDLSNRFSGEVLYGIVRSKGGERRVTEVIPEDVFRERFARRDGKPSPRPPFQPEAAQAQSVVENLTQELTLLRRQKEELEKKVERLGAQVHSAQNESPDGPALVRWNDVTDTVTCHDEERITVGQVGEKIKELINSGVKAEDIEVWSRRRTPRVRVELEE